MPEKYFEKELIMMLTFEKVLEVFNDFLSQDKECEVVMTRRGYVVLDWGSPQSKYPTAERCGTPEELLESLLSTYDSELGVRIAHGQRNLTEEETAEFKAQCELMRGKCMCS